MFPSPARRKELLDCWTGKNPSWVEGVSDAYAATVDDGDGDAEAKEDELRKRVFTDALSYTEEEGTETIVGGSPNRVVGCWFAACFSMAYQRAERYPPVVQSDDHAHRGHHVALLWAGGAAEDIQARGGGEDVKSGALDVGRAFVQHGMACMYSWVLRFIVLIKFSLIKHAMR